jgi:hypothetical protein
MLQQNSQPYLIVSSIIFCLVSIIHLVRALSGWDFVIGPITLTIAVSWVGFVITALMCFWAIRLITAGKNQQA